MKKGKIKVVGYDNVYNVVEQGIMQDSNGSAIFIGDKVLYERDCKYNVINEFLEKYNLTLAQMKVSYENVEYDVEITNDVITKIDVDSTQLQNFVKKEDIKLFKIPVWAEFSGFIEILGTSLDNACDRASEDESFIPIPFDKEYIDGSFQIGTVEDADFYNAENGKVEDTIK